MLKPLRLMQAAMLVCAIALVQACANNPLAIAETPLQKAYAIEASYNIVLEQSIEVARAQPTLRDEIQAVEARTTPIIDSLGQAIVEYTVERAKFAQGMTSAAAAEVVARNLDDWLTRAEAALVSLATALE